MNYLFSSESVSEGHPDKICDQVSDAILDAYLSQDSNARVAVETLITSRKFVIAGEVTSTAHVDAISVARETIRNIGYTDEAIGFDCDTANYENLIHAQSPEINSSVADGGAGDQGLMFGYATNETGILLPLPIVLANSLMSRQAELRKAGHLDWLLPDAKSQVTVRYENNIPKGVEKVVFSTQHKPEVTLEYIQKELNDYIIYPIISSYIKDKEPEILINTSGSFTQGGPHSDTGLTGRKIIVDTYGGSAPHGGGAFSGKDPSKVDRSAAYAARFVAKQIVYAGLADRCTVQLSYAIGKSEPLAFYLNTHGTGKVDEEKIQEKILELIDLTPNGIIKQLDLKRPIYLRTAAYGHFTNQTNSWEFRDDKIVRRLQKLIQ
jgi:S-adenosylmethionine synthetase